MDAYLVVLLLIFVLWGGFAVKLAIADKKDQRRYQRKERNANKRKEPNRHNEPNNAASQYNDANQNNGAAPKPKD